MFQRCMFLRDCWCFQDKDGDGTITANEFTAGIKQLGLQGQITNQEINDAMRSKYTMATRAPSLLGRLGLLCLPDLQVIPSIM